jgi:hypothetical protein
MAAFSSSAPEDEESIPEHSPNKMSKNPLKEQEVIHESNTVYFSDGGD